MAAVCYAYRMSPLDFYRLKVPQVNALIAYAKKVNERR